METYLAGLVTSIAGNFIFDVAKNVLTKVITMAKKKESEIPESTGNSPENREKTPDTVENEPESENREKMSDAVENEPESENRATMPKSGDSAGKTPLKPCPQCQSLNVKPLGRPEKNDYRGIETIIKQNARCEECGTVYTSRVSIPKPPKYPSCLPN